jgi:SdpC family antimicrobial peptide
MFQAGWRALTTCTAVKQGRPNGRRKGRRDPMKKAESYLMKLRRFHYAIALMLVASLIIFLVRPGLSASSSNTGQRNQRHAGEEIFRGLLFGEGEIAEKFPQIWKHPQVVEQMKKPGRLEQWNIFKERVIAGIKKKDHTFFDRFGEEIQSGDHLRIVDILNESGQAIRGQLMELQAMANKSHPLKAAALPTSKKGKIASAKNGEAKIIKTSLSTTAQDPSTTICDGGICATEDSTGVSVYDDLDNPQGASAFGCSYLAVCFAVVLVAAYAVAFALVAVVSTVWKWKGRYSYDELDSAESLYQEMLVDSIAYELYAY